MSAATDNHKEVNVWYARYSTTHSGSGWRRCYLEARRPRTTRPRQSAVSRSRSVDRTHRRPWRDLPDVFGRWNTAFRRFRRWAKKGVFEHMFKALSADADFEYVVNGTERCPVFGKIRCPIFCTLKDSNPGGYPEAALPSSSFTATLSIPALRLVLSR